MRKRLKEHIQGQIWLYVIVITVLGIGLGLGETRAAELTEGTKGFLSTIVDNFVAGKTSGIDQTSILASALLSQVKTVGLMWFLGLTVVGIPLILGVVLIRSFSLGFTLGFLLKEKGKEGTILVIASVLPQNLVYLPLLVVAAVVSLSFSLFIIKGQFNKGTELWKGFFIYTFIMFLLLIGFGIGSLIEAYLAPSLTAWLLW